MHFGKKPMTEIKIAAEDGWKLKITLLRKLMIQSAASVSSLLDSGYISDEFSNYGIMFCNGKAFSPWLMAIVALEPSAIPDKREQNYNN